MAVNQKCLYIAIWVSWLLSMLSALAFGTLSVLVLSGLFEWAGQVNLVDLASVWEQLSGVVGSNAILLLALAVYFVLSTSTLVGKLCGKKEKVLAFWDGALVASTFCMMLLTLQVALVVQASSYLTARAIQFTTALPTDTVTDNELFTATTVTGYVTSVLFLVLFIVLTSHQMAVKLNCCVGEDGKDGPKNSKKGAKTPPAVAAPVAGKDNSKSKVAMAPGSKV